MHYTFKTKDGLKEGFCTIGEHGGFVSFDNSAMKLYNNTNGTLVFDYNGEEVPFASVVKKSVKEVRDNIASGNNRTTPSDLLLAIICDGVENVRFSVEMPVPDMVFAGMAVCSDKEIHTECMIDLDDFDMPHQDYKIKLVPAKNSSGYGVACSRRYYTSDLFSLIKSGIVTINDSIDDGKTDEEHFREYFRKVTAKDWLDYRMD